MPADAPPPSMLGRLAKAALTTVFAGAGAVLIALSQGVGTGLVNYIGSYAPIFSSLGKASTTTSDNKDNSISKNKLSVTSKSVANDVLIAKIPFTLNEVGVGSTQGIACNEAVQRLTDLSVKQCQAVAVEQKALRNNLTYSEKNCGVCSSVGGSWRCAAVVKIRCDIFGESN